MQENPPRKLRVSNRFLISNDATVVTGDCLKVLRKLPDGIANVIVSSPPYNVGKEYETVTPLANYISLMKEVLTDCARLVADGGSLCWQVGSTFDRDGSLILIDKIVDNIMDDLASCYDLRLRNRIIWHYDHGLHSSYRFSGRYETILWYTKGASYKFNLNAVRVPQKYPGKKAYRGRNAGQYSGHPLGKNPSDFWMSESDVWGIPNVKSNHVEKTEHPCQFPIDLVARLILALSDPGDVVLDPFGGVGTTAATAVHLGRRAISIDVKAKYSLIARARVKKAWSGTLEFRRSAPPLTPPHSSLTVVPDAFVKARQLRETTSSSTQETVLVPSLVRRSII